MKLEDGLYQVKYKGITAGFAINNGELTICAPVLRKNFKHWKKRAKKVVLFEK